MKNIDKNGTLMQKKKKKKKKKLMANNTRGGGVNEGNFKEYWRKGTKE